MCELLFADIWLVVLYVWMTVKSTVSTLKGPGDPVEKGDQRGSLIVKKEITQKGDPKRRVCNT